MWVRNVQKCGTWVGGQTTDVGTVSLENLLPDDQVSTVGMVPAVAILKTVITIAGLFFGEERIVGSRPDPDHKSLCP